VSTGCTSKLIASTSVPLIALNAPHAVCAHERREAQASRREEITVAARRIEENIQRVLLPAGAVGDSGRRTIDGAVRD